MILITQPRARPLAGREPPLLEAVAENLDAASAKDRIREEAMKERRIRIGELIPVANIWSLPPVSTERIALFLAPCAADDMLGESYSTAGEHENITICEIFCRALAGLVHKKGGLTDAKTLILAQALMLLEPGLFDT
ncbi:ADP-ribose pyrophosphatase [Novosphingobium resinovorum]|uniref:ADP-ribose pyrophosphatase n=1 Tax=Novosphingobium resinovorum TaxID=158500 RepID=UPI001E57C5BF|nr:ADP-ribose pyrophosphatase [Novosphingobium resinovorum]